MEVVLISKTSTLILFTEFCYILFYVKYLPKNFILVLIMIFFIKNIRNRILSLIDKRINVISKYLSNKKLQIESNKN